MFYANPEGATVNISLLDKGGKELEKVEFTQAGDGSPTIKFSKAYAPGTYTIKIENNKNNGAHFVMGSGLPGDIEVTIGGNCGTNENTMGAPCMFLTGAVNPGDSGSSTTDDPGRPENPGNSDTADAAVIAIASLACIALAGVVIAKKIR